jgi:hypothetical protein
VTSPIRVVRRRWHVLFVTGGVGLCMVVAMAPSALGQPATAHAAGASVPVTPCPFIPEPGFAKPPASPPSVALPPSVTLPPGGAVYGADEDGARMTFSIGPAGLHCSVAEGVDGTFIVSLAASSRAVPPVEYTFNTGGINMGPQIACPYFPALISIVAPVAPPGTDYCTRPVGAVVTQIPTGQPQMWAATILDPPGVPFAVDAIPSGRETLNVMVASTDRAQFATCALPPGQQQVCVAGLDYFVTQTMAAQAGPATVAAIQAGIGTMARGPGSSGAAPEPECHADVDVSLEDKIDTLAQKPIGIPADVVDLPELEGQVNVSFVPEDVAVCDSRLKPVLNTPGGFDYGELSVGATLSGGARRGPFVYRADFTRWTSTPGAPAGQHLVTKFNLASVSASVDPKLSLGFDSTGRLEPFLDIATISIAAFKLEVTLVEQSGALLQVGLGPTLEITAGIGPQEAEEEVEEGVSEGLPTGAIDLAVADDDGVDTAVGMEEAAKEVDGLEISPEVSEPLAQELAGSIFTDLEADPVLAGFTPADITDDFPPDDQPIDSGFTAADGAGVDTEALGLGDILVDAPEFILVLA